MKMMLGLLVIEQRLCDGGIDLSFHSSAEPHRREYATVAGKPNSPDRGIEHILCAKPRARSSMKVACHCSQVASRAPPGSEEAQIPQSQLVAA